ncbi:MAG: hypothetical protein E6Q62_00800 [Nitrosomonas sp.]|nr:MAG: hypothetical protein E6Q62_00800 [Nitrosomonas sp.]
MSNISFRAIPSTQTGIDFLGRTWGGAWGDVNNDSYPDLWVNNHELFNNNPHGILYLNQRNGSFTNITATIFTELPRSDHHGPAWADFDNDGDQDFIQLVGAPYGLAIGPQWSNQFYINENGMLDDQASERGVDYPLAVGLNPLWADANHDGLLDLIVGVQPRKDDLEAPPRVFLQQADHSFEAAPASIGFNLTDARYFLLSDLSGDGKLDLIARTNPNDFTVYDTSLPTFRDITASTIPNAIAAEDAVTADFNGDLRPDVYLTQGAIRAGNDFYQNDTNEAIVGLSVKREEKGIEIDTTKQITFDIFNTFNGKYSIPLDQVYIGAAGIHPASWKFTLSPQDPSVNGIFPHTPGVDRGIFVGYDPSLQRWQFKLSSSDHIDIDNNILDENRILTFIETANAISKLTAIGFQPDPPAVNDQLWMNTGSGFVNQSQQAGINHIPIHGNNVVAGDFDNDMDQDIFIVTSRTVINTPDILYENQGNGTFVAVPDAGGAAGTTIGEGDFVTTADYNLDGSLDLLVANGRGQISPINTFAPYELFHNEGNTNHWFEIDLQGITSNRDGIGAQIFLTAGGTTQLREQAGGAHNQVQNHSRIHFGLASNTLVQELAIHWPSGIVQIIKNIPADQLFRVVESAGRLLASTAGNDILTGAATNDTATYLYSTAAVSVSLAITGQQNTIGAGFDQLINIENLTGSNFDDILKGNSQNNILRGNAGNDRLIGNSGVDTLIGGLGNDSYVIDNTNDLIIENLNSGTDNVSSTITYALAANVENLQLTGTSTINGTGNGLANTLIGNSANNTLNGNAGNDWINGNAGTNTLIGGLGNDIFVINNPGNVITELLNEGIDRVNSSVTHSLAANIENLTLTGTSPINGTGNNLPNSIVGNPANNQLKGGNGNDILDGLTGSNTLTGGPGNDIFRFTTTGHVDTISDFIVVNDTIQLENAVFTSLITNGLLPPGQFIIGDRALDANDFIIYNRTAGALFYDADGSGAGVAKQFAVTGSGLAMTNADIMVI